MLSKETSNDKSSPQIIPNGDDLATMTPMLKQYYEIKSRCQDAVLFFRMGDFYEMFGADAEEVAPKLDIVLTSRERGDKNKIPFCGVPHHSARNYWIKLLKLGYKVAIADQMENPEEAKGLVMRDISRILTPGSVDELEGLEHDEPNFIAAFYEDPKTRSALFTVADVSTGELRLGILGDEHDLLKVVEHFKPKELLARGFFCEALKNILSPYLNQNNLLVTVLPEGILRDDKGQESLLLEFLKKPDLKEEPCGAIPGGEVIIAAMFTYFVELKKKHNHFLTVRPLFEPDTMVLNATVLRDLEIFETVRRREAEGSLFREINATLSPMGARLLRYSLAHPFINRSSIEERHKLIEEILSFGESFLVELRSSLKSTPDLQRLLTRLQTKSIHPVELGLVRQTLVKVGVVLTGMQKGSVTCDKLSKILDALHLYRKPLELLEKALIDGPLEIGNGSDVFKPGFDDHLDQKLELSRSGEEKVACYEQKLKEEAGISSLKVRNHKTFGMLIEVTKTNLNKVPASFIRRQTMVNGERFVTIELKELGDLLLTARGDAIQYELELYQELLDKIGEFVSDMRLIADAIAKLDLIQGLAWVALRQDYCKPSLSEGEVVELKGSRHPVVEKFVGRHSFVANNVKLEHSSKHLLVTGPNMAGKSTIMRQIAISAILCQIGSFVPAKGAKLPIFDRIFTRVGASDDLSRGQSTFMVEMAEAAQILRQATERSLVILDEVGRGTSTQDGLAIASAILEDLALRVRCFSLFATHYHEIVPLAETFPSVRVVKTEVLEKENTIVFTHRLIGGASGSSYGLEVAKIAGIPEKVLERARTFLEYNRTHEAESERPVCRGVIEKSGKEPTDPLPLEVKGMSLELRKNPEISSQNIQLFQEIAQKIMELKIHRMTPLQALNFLDELKSRLQNPQQPTLFS